MENNSFKKGLIAGIPICLGYLSVAFAFGIFARESGLSFWHTLIISMTNLTSAGQLAAVPIIAGDGGIIVLALSQLVINLRYALMSISLSQKVSKNVKMMDRFIISFANTDEVFAVATGLSGSVGKRFLYGLIIPPYIGWSLGTFIGASAGNILPENVISALGVAIYAMFIAIVIPPSKKHKGTLYCIIFAIALSLIFSYVPVLNAIPQGLRVIISAVIASTILAIIEPVDIAEVEE